MIAFRTIPQAIRSIPPPVLIIGTLLLAIVLSASAAGFAGHRIGRDVGFDDGRDDGYIAGKSSGFEEGKSAGFEEGKTLGLREADRKYQVGYSDGRSAGYKQGYDAATKEALRVIQERVPGLIELAYLAGRSAGSTRYVPTYPTFDIGSTSFHCESEVNVFGDIETDCREAY